uniref:Cytochrome b5 heme-binding domain-containing protein n=1 Tax=Chromera velia CCMP2878 TaxID=1169474 RepID=A0A0G4I055_9ALVE|eukprot:Cvel_9849.t1-p1 / transcript=Cvel_9849.t1 / gene=Cvel_9849 / organism=Chromera_velia_CCMP2878 / gene_product=Cytochrome b5 isoform B, putative / transcript_product=Cytochrome b5 isoform B, putative / location=Cvel_scaffold580:5097-6772(-) / protein_length=530 / sequence_SO=supercontig / SO=protein_coding / is_pseudo=false
MKTHESQESEELNVNTLAQDGGGFTGTTPEKVWKISVKSDPLCSPLVCPGPDNCALLNCGPERAAALYKRHPQCDACRVCCDVCNFRECLACRSKALACFAKRRGGRRRGHQRDSPHLVPSRAPPDGTGPSSSSPEVLPHLSPISPSYPTLVGTVETEREREATRGRRFLEERPREIKVHSAEDTKSACSSGAYSGSACLAGGVSLTSHPQTVQHSTMAVDTTVPSPQSLPSRRGRTESPGSPPPASTRSPDTEGEPDEGEGGMSPSEERVQTPPPHPRPPGWGERGGETGVSEDTNDPCQSPAVSLSLVGPLFPNSQGDHTNATPSDSNTRRLSPSNPLPSSADPPAISSGPSSSRDPLSEGGMRWQQQQREEKEIRRARMRKPSPSGGASSFSSGDELLSWTPCQVRRHSLPNDCWIVANGLVYDATEVLASHPGGPFSILQKAGGADCTTDFDFHSSATRRTLWPSLVVGRLAPCAGFNKRQRDEERRKKEKEEGGGVRRESVGVNGKRGSACYGGANVEAGGCGIM